MPRRIAKACASIVALIGLLKLTGVLLGWQFGVDQLLFQEMGPITALNFLLLGSALSLLSTRRTRRNLLLAAQYLALVAIFASWLPLFGYDISYFYGTITYVAIALHTALTFVVLAVGILCARPEGGMMETFTSDSVGGVVARRLSPAAIFIPTVLGWLRLEGEKAGVYDTELGVALMVVTSMVVLAVLVGWNARLLYRSDIERKRVEEEIRHLNEALEERVTERTAQLADRERRLEDLVGRLVAAQEEERRRVAYEVHDGPTQVATAAHQHRQAFADEHPPGSTVGPGELDRTLELVQRTVKEARRISEGLRPTALDDFGLATAVRLRVEELENEGWEICHEEALGEERLPPQLETALYRVAQEALTNARKHARTTRARTALVRLPGKVRLEVRDEGRGFAPSAASKDGGPGERVGLSSMRERVALLGGRLEITSKPGAGTSLVAEVPLSASGERDTGYAV